MSVFAKIDGSFIYNGIRFNFKKGDELPFRSDTAKRHKRLFSFKKEEEKGETKKVIVAQVVNLEDVKCNKGKRSKGKDA